MSDITRLLVNLGISYALMNREQFTEKFAVLFEKYNWDEEKIQQAANLFFVELEHWQMKKSAEDTYTKAHERGNEPLTEQMRRLTDEIIRLNREIQDLKKG